MRFITKKEKGNANGLYRKQKFPKLPEFEPKTILRKKPKEECNKLKR